MIFIFHIRKALIKDNKIKTTIYVINVTPYMVVFILLSFISALRIWNIKIIRLLKEFRTDKKGSSMCKRKVRSKKDKYRHREKVYCYRSHRHL
jgi:hypothetical protein